MDSLHTNFIEQRDPFEGPSSPMLTTTWYDRTGGHEVGAFSRVEAVWSVWFACVTSVSIVHFPSASSGVAGVPCRPSLQAAQEPRGCQGICGLHAKILSSTHFNSYTLSYSNKNAIKFHQPSPPAVPAVDRQDPSRHQVTKLKTKTRV